MSWRSSAHSGAARPHRPVELLLYAVGAAGAFVWLQSMFPRPTIAVAAALIVALRVVADRRGSGVARRAAQLALVAVHLLCLYLLVVFTWLLGWTLSWPLWLVLAGLTALAVRDLLRPSARLRVPLLLPLGLTICALLVGWLREDGVIRCDDALRLRAQPGVRLLLPTSVEVERCAAGETLRIGRYPRRIWEAPDSSRFYVTTQQGIYLLRHGRPVADPIEGSVCEFAADGTRRACVGREGNKMQVIFDSPSLDRVFVGGWSSGAGVLYALPRSAPLQILGEVHTHGSTGEGFYDPDSDQIGLFADECTDLTRFRASDLAPLPPINAPFCPGEAHYDPNRQEGIICFAPGPLGPQMNDVGRNYLSVAFRGNPFSYHLLGDSPRDLWTYAALVWGCEFDPSSRTAWTMIANLGLIAVLDYDSGAITDVWLSEPGLRSVTYDADRNQLYASNFLLGDVVAIDAATGRETARWFVGRYARYVALTRDRTALLATSNLGVIRIELPNQPAR